MEHKTNNTVQNESHELTWLHPKPLLEQEPSKQLIFGLGVPVLTEIQETAKHLHGLGWNVFPVPAPKEVRAWAEATNRPTETNSKPPYILQPLFRSRMHPTGEFYDLFDYANIAVIAGKTSGNLAIIDADKNGDIVRKELNRRMVPYWEYKTGKGSNFIVRIAEGEAQNLPAGKTTIEGVEVWGNNHYCVIPPSLHYLGCFYDWVNVYPLHEIENIKPVSINELDFLGACLLSDSWQYPDLYGLPEWTSLLSLNNRQILSSVIEYGERNTKLTAPIYDICAHIQLGNISENEAIELLYKVADNCQPPYPHKQINSMIDSAMRKKDLEPARKNHTKGQQVYIQALAFASTHCWKGRTAQTDRAVYLALAERAKLDGEVFSASCRHVSELANVSEKTVRTSLHRLQNHEPPYIELVSRDAMRREPNKYRFYDLSLFAEQIPSYRISNPLLYSEVNKHAFFDVFSRLGKVAMRCYEHLLEQPEPMIKTIAEHTRQNPSSCSKAIKKLRTHGLVFISRAEGLYMGTQVTGERLREIAETLGTAGRTQKREQYHEAQRQVRVNKDIYWARLKWKKTIDNYYKRLEIEQRNN